MDSPACARPLASVPLRPACRRLLSTIAADAMAALPKRQQEVRDYLAFASVEEDRDVAAELVALAHRARASASYGAVVARRWGGGY